MKYSDDYIAGFKACRDLVENRARDYYHMSVDPTSDGKFSEGVECLEEAIIETLDLHGPIKQPETE